MKEIYRETRVTEERNDSSDRVTPEVKQTQINYKMKRKTVYQQHVVSDENGMEMDLNCAKCKK